MNPEESPLFVQSLASGLSVLQAFNGEKHLMSLPEIAAAAGITKSAAQRFAFTLESLGLLVKDPATKRFALSPRTIDTGYRYLQSHPVLERANPYLLELNCTSRETVNLAERDGLEVIHIARFPSPVRSMAHMPVGRRIPLYCSSSGRAYLSGLPEQEALNLIRASDLIRYTQHTVTDPDELMRRIEHAREQGFAVVEGEYFRGDLAISVPIFNRGERPIAAVNISVAATNWTAAKATAKFVPMLLETARLISTTPPTPLALAPFRIGIQSPKTQSNEV